jgi:hypothetical protein
MTLCNYISGNKSVRYVFYTDMQLISLSKGIKWKPRELLEEGREASRS